MSKAARGFPPKVTGISPKEGPPGTKIVLRGEHLGTSAHDLVSCLIGGHECVFQAEWQGPSKILCRSGACEGPCDIIVTTKSGGRGTCAVQFRGYLELVGPLKDSAVWVEDRFGESGGKNQTQSAVHAMDDHDPLAINDEPSECAYSYEQMLEMFHDGSGDISQKNFVPAWFLLENHSGATLDDLRHGLRHIQTVNKRQNDGPVAYVKAHLNSYFECIDTLDNLEVRFGEDSGLFVESVDGLIAKIGLAREMSNHTYQGVFERRKRIDFYRNCLSTIHRFHYLFRLLTKIHKNIRVRRVHELMPDYGRLKQLVGPSPPKVLQDVLDEVERKLTGLRQSMREELEAMPGRIERQVVLAHDLSELGDPGDPGWECLEKFKAYTIGKMFEIYSHHFKNPSGAVAEVKRSLRDDDADVRMQLEFKVASPFDMDYHDLTGASTRATISTAKVESGRFAKRNDRPESIASSAVSGLIRSLTEFVVRCLGHFTGLSEAYFNAEMQRDLKGRELMLRTEAGKEKEARQPLMLREIVELYVTMVQCMLGPGDVVIRAADFSDAAQAIDQVLESVEEDYSECGALLRSLLRAMERTFVLAVLDRGIAEMEALWANAMDRSEKTLRLAARMPEIFTAVAVKTHSMTKRFVRDGAGTLNVLEDYWSRLLNAPAEILREIGTMHAGTVAFFALMSVNTIMLKVLPRLFRMLDNLARGALEGEEDSILNRYTHLSAHLTRVFVDKKADLVAGVIEKQMNDYGVDWKHAGEPREVNAYVTRIALDLNAVMEELCVFANEPGMNEEIMQGIVARVCEEVNRLFFVAPGFNANGVLQGQADLAGLQLVIGPYMSPPATKMLTEISQLLEQQKLTFKKDALTKLVAQYTKTHHRLFLSR